MIKANFRFRRVIVSVPADVDDDPKPGTDQTAPPPPPPPDPPPDPNVTSGDAVHEPQTPQEMAEYLQSKEKRDKQAALAAAYVPPPPHEKRHQVMPPDSQRPKSLPAPGTLRPAPAQTAAMESQAAAPVMKVKTDDGQVHTGKNLHEVAGKIVRGKKTGRK